jgi:hypothetical protein
VRVCETHLALHFGSRQLLTQLFYQRLRLGHTGAHLLSLRRDAILLLTNLVHARLGLWRADLLWDVSTLCAVVPPAGLYGVVGTGVLWAVSTLCAVAPHPGLYGVVGTGLLWDVSTLCAVVPPAGLYGVVGTGLLWDVSTLCAVVPPAGLYGVVPSWSLLSKVEL